MFRVPLLLQPSTAVIHRLDTASTRSFDPPGDPSSGYNDLLSEPTVYTAGSATRTESQQYLAAVRVPCQVEVASFEELQQFGPGIVENVVMTLVTHRADLETLGLLDTTTRAPLIKKHDKITAIERYGSSGTSQVPLRNPLYVFEVRPASFGFGDEGHDLELIFLEDRAKAQRA